MTNSLRIGDLIYYRFRYSMPDLGPASTWRLPGTGSTGSYAVVVDIKGDKLSLYYKGKITIIGHRSLLELLRGKHYTFIQRLVIREDHD